MLGAEMICSDGACARETEVVVAAVEELDLLVCDDCGCLLTTLAVWEVTEVRPGLAAGAVVALPAGRMRRPPGRLAA